MSRYKELCDAYASNTEALMAYRTEARDALKKIREAVRKHLDLIVVETDLVRIISDSGESVFPLLARLEHGDSVGFNVAISVGGDGGLPKSDLVIPASLSGKAGEIKLDVPSLHLVRKLGTEESYQEVAQLLFGAMLKRLESF